MRGRERDREKREREREAEARGKRQEARGKRQEARGRERPFARGTSDDAIAEKPRRLSKRPTTEPPQAEPPVCVC
eukprot:COSAG03_NODE_10557_length_643_cov_1.161765_1_plen_74_part_01